ncbi:MAG: hypothetical protein RIT45_1201 [Pseudomonadota bacterium]
MRPSPVQHDRRSRRAAASMALLFTCVASATGCARFHAAPPPGAPKDANFATIDGVRLRYVDEGPREGAPTLLLIHGFAASLDTWGGIRHAVAGRARVIAADLKGFGYSGRPAGDYSPAAQARLLLGLLDHLGAGKVAIVAHSWGSSVALQLTLAAPERVERVALYDAWVFEAQLPPFFLWARAAGLGEALFGLVYRERAEDRLELAFYAPERVPQALVDHALAGIERPGTVAAHLAAVRGQRYAEVERRYREVRQPVLLLWGREDRVTLLRYGERLQRELPDARMRVYPRCGHFPMLEAFAESTRDLVEFLGLQGGVR